MDSLAGAHLGLVINFPKSELEAQQLFLFLGMLYDTIKGVCYPPERLLKLEELLEMVLWLSRPMAQMVINGPGYRDLGREANSLHQYTHEKSSDRSDQPVDLWQGPPREAGGTQPADYSRFAVLDGQSPYPERDAFGPVCTRGSADDRCQPVSVGSANGPLLRGTWEMPSTNAYINHLELDAVGRRELLRLTQQCMGKNVLMFTDNTVATYYIDRQGDTRVLQMVEIARAIFSWAEKIGVFLRARHIPGKLNVIADGLSRRKVIISTECSCWSCW